MKHELDRLTQAIRWYSEEVEDLTAHAKRGCGISYLEEALEERREKIKALCDKQYALDLLYLACWRALGSLAKPPKAHGPNEQMQLGI